MTITVARRGAPARRILVGTKLWGSRLVRPGRCLRDRGADLPVHAQVCRGDGSLDFCLQLESGRLQALLLESSRTYFFVMPGRTYHPAFLREKTSAPASSKAVVVREVTMKCAFPALWIQAQAYHPQGRTARS